MQIQLRDGRLHRLLLEAGAAEHRPALIGAEWDSGLGAAFGTNGAGFRTRPSGARGSLGLAFLAVLRIVDKLFRVEKSLFVRGKGKVLAANYTL